MEPDLYRLVLSADDTFRADDADLELSRRGSPAFRWGSAALGGTAVLKPERLLCRWRWLDVNALQREHADLGRRAAGCGKTANLAACRQDPVAGDDQRHRILCHGVADIARSFRSGAEFLRQPYTGPTERGHQTARIGCYIAGTGQQLRPQHFHRAAGDARFG